MMRAMRISSFSSIAWIAIAIAPVACGGDARPPVGPVDVDAMDPGPGRVRKSPFDCADAPVAVTAPTPAPAAEARAASGISFDPRGERLAHWTGRRLVVRSARDGAIAWEGAGSGTVFRDDGTQIASFEDGAVVVRALPSGAEVLRAARAGDPLAAAWSDDGARLWVVDTSASTVYDVGARTQCRGSYTPHATPATFTISPDRTRAVTTFAADGGTGAAQLFLLVKGARDEALAVAPGAPNGDGAFAFSRSGLVVAAASEAGVFVWDARTGRRAEPMADSRGASGAALGDNGALVAAIVGARARVWDTTTTKLVRELAPSAAPVAVAFFAARARVAIVTSEGVDALDTATGAVAWSKR